MAVQVHAGHASATLEESERAEMSAIVAVCDNHEGAAEGVRELQRTGLASNLTDFGQRVKIHEAESQSATLTWPSQPTLDICDQRFLCRMAKKLGCHLCAKE